MKNLLVDNIAIKDSRKPACADEDYSSCRIINNHSYYLHGQTHGSFFAKGKDVPGAVGERLRRWISEQKGDKSMADGRVGSGI